VEHQVDAGGLEIEELAVPAYVVDERALQRAERRVIGLERAELDEVDLGDGAVAQPALQVEGQRLDLRQLGHAASVGTPRAAERSMRLASRI
jgi:hypothetical protein